LSVSKLSYKEWSINERVVLNKHRGVKPMYSMNYVKPMYSV